MIGKRPVATHKMRPRRIVIVRDHSLDSWDVIKTKFEIYKDIRKSRSFKISKRNNIGLDTLPKEVLMNILFPFFNIKCLYELSRVNTKWEEIAKNYMRDFNKIVEMTVNNENRTLFRFATRDAQKLEKLKLKWTTGQESCSDVLVDVLEQSNNLKEFSIITNGPQSRISNKVLDAISAIEQRLRRLSVKLHLNGKLRCITRKDFTNRENLIKVKHNNSISSKRMSRYYLCKGTPSTPI